MKQAKSLLIIMDAYGGIFRFLLGNLVHPGISFAPYIRDLVSVISTVPKTKDGGIQILRHSLSLEVEVKSDLILHLNVGFIL